MPFKQMPQYLFMKNYRISLIFIKLWFKSCTDVLSILPNVKNKTKTMFICNLKKCIVLIKIIEVLTAPLTKTVYNKSEVYIFSTGDLGFYDLEGEDGNSFLKSEKDDFQKVKKRTVDSRQTEFVYNLDEEDSIQKPKRKKNTPNSIRAISTGEILDEYLHYNKSDVIVNDTDETFKISEDLDELDRKVDENDLEESNVVEGVVQDGDDFSELSDEIDTIEKAINDNGIFSGVLSEFEDIDDSKLELQEAVLENQSNAGDGDSSKGTESVIESAFPHEIDEIIRHEEFKPDNISVTSSPEEGAENATDIFGEEECIKEISFDVGTNLYRCIERGSAEKRFYVIQNIILTWLMIGSIIWTCLWCNKGWCACCCICDACQVNKRINTVKKFLAENPPGHWTNDEENFSYPPSGKEIQIYDEMLYKIMNL